MTLVENRPSVTEYILPTPEASSANPALFFSRFEQIYDALASGPQNTHAICTQKLLMNNGTECGVLREAKTTVRNTEVTLSLSTGLVMDETGEEQPFRKATLLSRPGGDGDENRMIILMEGGTQSTVRHDVQDAEGKLTSNAFTEAIPFIDAATQDFAEILDIKFNETA